MTTSKKRAPKGADRSKNRAAKQAARKLQQGDPGLSYVESLRLVKENRRGGEAPAEPLFGDLASDSAGYTGDWARRSTVDPGESLRAHIESSRVSSDDYARSVEEIL